MAGSSEKVPIASAGPEDLQQFMPPAYTAVAMKPAATGRLLKAGIAVLIVGAILLLFGAVGAFYFWNNNNNKHVYNVHYSMSINGKVEEGSMEIDAVNNVERIRTGEGINEAVEVHDFQIGITAIRFAGGEKCYIKSQVKARLPDLETIDKESLLLDLEDEVMPAKFEEDSLIWVAADSPLSDAGFLSKKIADLCGDLPIFWLRPTYANAGSERKKRAAPRQRGQAPRYEEEEDVEAEFNPENPYHRGLEGDEGTMTFDPMLDHQGVCCAECRRSYTHCERICEPLGGFHPWPYHYQGCRVACRVIMPCRWWVGRILGIL